MSAGAGGRNRSSCRPAWMESTEGPVSLWVVCGDFQLHRAGGEDQIGATQWSLQVSRTQPEGVGAEGKHGR